MVERAFGPYRLVRQIAVGGMAEIHLAKTKGIAGFEKYCALKMIHPNFAEDEQFIQMLVDEAKIAVQLTHGNIAQTFDLGRVGETYYITMEYVDGADLYKILRRGSEQDLEMPLDVCAFIAKEIASALDHAHRKRDHAGKPLGIVHRDVSPQNVLVSYAGEVKLVDFGIAKATMKARQTAVGVIKGKYYYMSPEQAWGDPIDYRSDIFSSGIVLYEMITGQMLYLEEDLHKLLDMARKADIAPPSKLRKGVPPQLERIVMHALAKAPADRYQSAGDLASDLERFLHGYAPVFTASKIAGLIRQVLGDPMQIPVAEEQGMPSIEIRDGINSTHTLDTSDLLHDREDIRDENSVIFVLDDLGRPQPRTPPKTPPLASPTVRPSAPRTTRAADPAPPIPARPAPAPAPAKIPSIAKPAPKPAPKPAAKPVTPARPRQMHEETRQLETKAPPGPDDESGLLTPYGKRVSPASWDSTDTHPGLEDGDELANIGERTVVTGGSGGGFMIDLGGEDAVEATLITGFPQAPDAGDAPALADDPADDDDGPTHDGRHNRIDQVAVDVAGAGEGGDDDEAAPADEDGPTMSRAFVPRASRTKAPPPAALTAKIHAPAVSELRKPRASRRTPPGGVPNVLQQIVGAQVNEPMPVPRPGAPTPMPMPQQPPPAPLMQPPPFQPPFPAATPGAQYAHDASGMPLGIPTPPSGLPAAPGPQPHLEQYMQPPPGYPQQPQYPQAPPQYQQTPPAGYPVSPGGLYQFSPYGAPPPQPMTLTGQLRLFEVDELPSQYKLGSARRRWFAYVVAGLMAVSVAAAATFFIIRTTRESAPVTGSVHIESVPPGADVVFDGQRRTDKTPLTIEGIDVGTRHDIKIELARHKPYTDTIDIPKSGGEVQVMALLKPVTGKIVVNSQPGGAEIRINDQLRGRTPTTLNDIDMTSAKRIELRLKDYQPHGQDLTWPSSGQIDLDIKLQR